MFNGSPEENAKRRRSEDAKGTECARGTIKAQSPFCPFRVFAPSPLRVLFGSFRFAIASAEGWDTRRYLAARCVSACAGSTLCISAMAAQQVALKEAYWASPCGKAASKW